MTLTRVIIGVDVGGTNTDAVVLDGKSVISKAKTSTTSDVKTGVQTAIHQALINSKSKGLTLGVKHVNIGTTHFINAFIEGKRLVKVSVLRLCGSASRKLPPYSDFPADLTDKIKGSVFMVNGGYEFDGKTIEDVDEAEIKECLQTMKLNGDKNIVVCGIFSPLRNEQEIHVREIIQKEYPEFSVTMSHKIGKIGLLERENAAILNETIKPLCSETIRGFRATLDDLGLQCPMFLTQNDGTVVSEDNAFHYPVFMFASGSTNSMRGAAFLSGLKDAIVVDIGGTSTDVGVLQKGFPREKASEILIGRIRTNFRMPDVISIGLGGGSYVEKLETGKVKIGPRSAGFQIENEALVFASSPDDVKGRSMTATDLATARGTANVGDKENVAHLDKDLVENGMKTINDMLTNCIDEMRLAASDLPLVLVGGGSILVDRKSKFEGVSDIISPEHFDVANAVGAALSQISFSIDKVIDLGQYIPVRGNTTEKGETDDENVMKERLLNARQAALEESIITAEKETIAAGAKEDSLITVEKEHTTISYMPGNAVRIQVKIVGDLHLDTIDTNANVPIALFETEPKIGMQSHKQTVSGTGKTLSEDKSVFEIKEPTIDTATGEWILNEYDIECISIGGGILGCGGGGNPHIGRLIALQTLAEGMEMRVVTPSKFLEKAHPENDRIALVAFMGAPLAVYERLIAGNESTDALECIQDLYSVGCYEDGELGNVGDTVVEEGNGVVFIDDYQRRGDQCLNKGSLQKNVIGVMSAEIGGMNSIEPLIVGAQLGLPILDCDGMGRAFPELQMFTPFIYGCKPYPCALADQRGRRAAVLKADSPKALENHFRNVVISMGCSGGLTLSTFNKSDILNKTVPHSMSHAWRIGDVVLKARYENRSPVDALISQENGVFLIYGKVVDVMKETTGGFNKGHLIVTGLDEFAGKKVEISFQNEFLLATDIVADERRVLVSTPDLITCMDADTAQPIATEEVRFGIRVAVVALGINPVMGSEEALKFVGPAAFGYPPDAYKPLGTFVEPEPVAPK